ncbi:hypothetical protein HDK90DRAFT_145873 [Phyllosticta capitalensis]|uniref:Uncharacterized protein n=1 Tax=Phyllosticta capitalensis TaxID=121624 RepID=A0ABR1YZK2_9PEZI
MHQRRSPFARFFLSRLRPDLIRPKSLTPQRKREEGEEKKKKKKTAASPGPACRRPTPKTSKCLSLPHQRRLHTVLVLAGQLLSPRSANIYYLHSTVPPGVSSQSSVPSPPLPRIARRRATPSLFPPAPRRLALSHGSVAKLNPCLISPTSASSPNPVSAISRPPSSLTH